MMLSTMAFGMQEANASGRGVESATTEKDLNQVKSGPSARKFQLVLRVDMRC